MSNNINKETNSLQTQGENIANSTDSSTSCDDSSNSTRTSANTETINQIILSGIESAKNIEFNLSQDNSTGTTTTNSTINSPSSSNSSNSTFANIAQDISQTSTLLQNINTIKEQLARLNLDPTQRFYFENCVNPLLTTLYELAASAATLSASVNILTTSPIVHPKTSQLKDTTHLIYNINEKCEDVYKVLKKRIDTMLNMC